MIDTFRFCLAALLAAVVPSALAQAPVAAKHAEPNLIEIVHRAIHLEGKKKEEVDALLEAYQRNVDQEEARLDHDRGAKRTAVGYLASELLHDLRPILSTHQYELVGEALYTTARPGPHARYGIGYWDLFPQGSEMRSIFGSSTGSFGLSYGGAEYVNRRMLIGFTVGGYEMETYGNNLFVITPEATFEYRVPIADRFYLFADAAGGYAYMDYSFDTPTHRHFGAKRGGLDGNVGLGLQIGPVRVEGDYVGLTEPAGINFDSIELSANVTLVRW